MFRFAQHDSAIYGMFRTECLAVRSVLASLSSLAMRDYLSSSGQFKFETTEGTAARRARLRIALAEAARADEALARRPSHDVNGDCRYSALDRTWVGNWSFLWLHAVISTENALIDLCGLGVPLQ